MTSGKKQFRRHWAPWRLSFILGPREKGCIFCRFPKEDPNQDKKNLILYRGRYNFIILNKYPYNNGHLMVVPYEHCQNLSKLSRATHGEMLFLASVANEALRSCMRAQGFNLGMNLGKEAGAGIADHLHLHVVPRWVGDSNFMPIIGETKILVEYLEDTYDRLAPAIKKAKKELSQKK